MFEQSILAHENVAHKTRALAASFGVQTLVVGVALLIPLIFGDHMPQVQLFARVAAPTRLQAEPVTQTQTASYEFCTIYVPRAREDIRLVVRDV